MILKISHSTKYYFEEPVHYALQQLRLLPKSGVGQNVVYWDVTVNGGVKELEFDDQFNNNVKGRSIRPICMVSSGRIMALRRCGFSSDQHL